MWKTLLAVIASLVVLVALPITGWVAGTNIGEEVCSHGEFLDCISEPITGGVIGFGIGLIISLVLLVFLALRYRHRRRELGADGLN